jgi:hypothetical protein
MWVAELAARLKRLVAKIAACSRDAKVWQQNWLLVEMVWQQNWLLV